MGESSSGRETALLRVRPPVPAASGTSARRTGIVLGSWPLGMSADPGFYLRIHSLVEKSGFDSLDHRGPLRAVVGVRGSPRPVRPVRPDGPPVWIGGRSGVALARAARHDGWCAYAVSEAQIDALARAVLA